MHITYYIFVNAESFIIIIALCRGVAVAAGICYARACARSVQSFIKSREEMKPSRAAELVINGGYLVAFCECVRPVCVLCFQLYEV